MNTRLLPQLTPQHEPRPRRRRLDPRIQPLHFAMADARFPRDARARDEVVEVAGLGLDFRHGGGFERPVGRVW